MNYKVALRIATIWGFMQKNPGYWSRTQKRRIFHTDNGIGKVLRSGGPRISYRTPDKTII